MEVIPPTTHTDRSQGPRTPGGALLFVGLLFAVLLAPDYLVPTMLVIAVVALVAGTITRFSRVESSRSTGDRGRRFARISRAVARETTSAPLRP